MNVLRVPTLPQKMTVDEFWDFCQLPENENRDFELVKGVVIEMSRPTKKHGFVTGNIARIVGNYTYATGRGYIASNDTGVILDDDDPSTVVGPDVAFYIDAQTFDDMHPKWGEEPPILAVEVLSPNDRPNRVNAKIRDYLESGVKVVWLVDYEDRTMSIYRPNRTLEVYNDTQTVTGGEELPGFTCSVAELFRMPGEKPTPPAPKTQQ